ncbi:MAG: hypothetical protein ACTS2B_12175 [Vibrio diabolicus]
MKISRSTIYLFGVVYFPLFIDYVALSLEYILAIGMTIVFLIELLLKMKVVKPALLVSFVFLSLTMLSLSRSFELTGYRDIVELIKPILFFLVFMFGVGITNYEQDVEKFASSIMILLLSMVIFGVLEAKIPIFNSLSSLVYKGSRDPVQFKGVLSFISPYTFASLLIMPIFIFLSALIFLKRKLVYFFLFLISILCLVLTQSKTVFLSLVFTMAIFPLSLLFRSWLPKRLELFSYFLLSIILLSISIPFILSYAEENLRYLYYGFEVVVEQIKTLNLDSIIYSTPSISNRYEQFLEVLQFQDTVPIIGKGIVKDIIYPESFYALYLLRYGILGMVINLVLVFYFGKYSLNLAKFYASRDRKYMCFFIGLYAYSLSLPISYFSSAVNDQTRSGFIFYLILGVLYAGNKALNRK